MMEFRLGEVGHSSAILYSVTQSHQDTTLRNWGDLERVEMIADGARDEARGDRGPVVMQDRDQPDGIDAALVDDERAQLRVAILLDNEHEIVVGDEARHARMERKGPHAQPIERMAARLDH